MFTPEFGSSASLRALDVDDNDCEYLLTVSSHFWKEADADVQPARKGQIFTSNIDSISFDSKKHENTTSLLNLQKWPLVGARKMLEKLNGEACNDFERSSAKLILPARKRERKGASGDSEKIFYKFSCDLGNPSAATVLALHFFDANGQRKK